MKFLYNLSSLSFKVKFSIVSAIFLVFGIFGAVMVSQQQQEIRSRAAGDINGDHPGDLIGDDFRVAGAVLGNITGNRNSVTKGVQGGIYGTANSISGNVGGCIRGDNNRVVGNVAGGVVGTNNFVTGTKGTGDCPPPGSTNPTIGVPTTTPTPTQVPTIIIAPSPTPIRLPTPTPTIIISGGTGNCATVNASSGEDLIADDCTIDSGFNGSVRGNRNNIRGGLGGAIGNIFGDNNLIGGGMNGTINGNGNEICGDLGGSINGNNNIIHGTLFRGGTDNGTGNLILPGTPCGYRPTPTMLPTATPTIPTPTPTSIPTPTPTSIPTPTPTPVGDTTFVFDLLLHGIGRGGDSANPNGGGNANPLHPQRQITIEVINAQNQSILTKTGLVSFNATNGNFTGSVNMGTTLITGSYTVKVKSSQFLRKIVPGIHTIIAGAVKQLPQAVLITGDVTGPMGVQDNTLNILDYNLIIGCYSDFLPAPSCTPENKLLSDLGDDGSVNQFDYNLFLRELNNIEGQ